MCHATFSPYCFYPSAQTFNRQISSLPNSYIDSNGWLHLIFDSHMPVIQPLFKNFQIIDPITRKIQLLSLRCFHLEWRLSRFSNWAGDAKSRRYAGGMNKTPNHGFSNGQNRHIECQDDEALIIRFREKGDDLAFEVLYKRYRRMMWYTILHRGVPDNDAETVLQNAATAIFQFLEREQPNNFPAVVYRFTDWKIADFYRKNQKHRSSESLDQLTEEGFDPIDSRASGPENDLSELRKTLQRYKLSEEQQEAAILHYVAGYTIPEIAAIVSVSPHTIKSRLRLAKEKCAKFFRKEGST